MDHQEAIKDFLGDRPGSDEIRDWRVALEQRLAALIQEQKRLGDQTLYASKIEQLKKQIAALGQEEAVTEFVEDSVRVTLAMGSESDRGDSEE